MDILKCKAFLSSVDDGSFSKAADKLGYTPSGITRMVNALEEELGIPMLKRTKHGVNLNEDGKRMIPFIREMVVQNDKACKMSNDIKGLTQGNLTIGTYSSIAIGWLPDIIKEYHKDYPEVSIDIYEAGNSELLTMLEMGKTDCCFFSEPPANVHWIPLHKDILVAWVPLDHPLAKEKTISPKQLNGVSYISTLPDRDTDIDRLFEREGIKPEIKYSTVDNYSTYTLVAAGLGLSINNSLMSKRWNEPVANIPFNPPQYVTLGIALPSMETATRATKTFIKYAEDYIKKNDVI